MRRNCWYLGLGGALVLSLWGASAHAAILGSHTLTWWDVPGVGVTVTQPGQNPPANGTKLLDLKEWHLDQAQTSTWYAGGAVAGPPANPFNAANRTGLIGAITPIAGAEAFIYELTNVNYGSGNGPVGVGFTFTDPVPPAPGVNDLSGINIIDSHGALQIAAPVVGSQFMFTTLGPPGNPSKVLDMTPGSILQPQDWDFNAFSGPGNFEWDISPAASSGVVIGQPAAVFGFAMPGNWYDAVNDGWVHSWNAAGGGVQVNLANGLQGFSGPRPIPEPATLIIWSLLGGLGVGLGWWRRRRLA